MKFKIKKIRGSLFYFPASWKEINPREARKNKHIAVCVSKGEVYVFYSDIPAWALSDEEAEQIIKRGNLDLGCHIYGIIDEPHLQKYNVGGARLITIGRRKKYND